jgi:hypothetical protein
MKTTPFRQLFRELSNFDLIQYVADISALFFSFREEEMISACLDSLEFCMLSIMGEKETNCSCALSHSAGIYVATPEASKSNGTPKSSYVRI